MSNGNGNGKFPETAANAITIDNSQVTGPLYFFGGDEAASDDDFPDGDLTDPNEVLEDLDPVFHKSLLNRHRPPSA